MSDNGFGFMEDLPAKRGRGRPRTRPLPPVDQESQPKRLEQPRKDQGHNEGKGQDKKKEIKAEISACQVPEILEDRSDGIEDFLKNQVNINLKDPLTVKELNFIELLVSGEYTKEKAMDLAGYGNLSQRWKYMVASKIIQKYESQAGDHRKVLRAVGIGEIKVAMKILELMECKESKLVQLGATRDAGKMLGMMDEVDDGRPGVSINILRRHAPIGPREKKEKEVALPPKMITE